MNELTAKNNENQLTVDISQQIAIAQQYKRNISEFLSDAIECVKSDVNIARECNYKLPRAGKEITGPSIRVAEIAMSCYGNCRAASRIIDVSHETGTITAEGIFIDLQKNNVIVKPLTVGIKDKHGRLFPEHLINTTMQAACSKALRNAILTGIPRSYINKIANEAMDTAIGKSGSIKDRVNSMLTIFLELGATKEQIEQKAGKKLEKFTLKDLKDFTGYYGSIKNNMSTIEEIFGEEKKTKDEIEDADFVETGIIEDE